MDTYTYKYNWHFVWILGLAMFTLTSCSQKTAYRSGSVNKSYTPNSSISGKRALLVKEAKNQIGSRYRYGGAKPGGFDCSGLTCYVYAQHKIALERTSSAQARQGIKVALDQAMPGDLLFFGKARVEHVGILVKRTSEQLIMVHSSKSKGVIETNVNTSSYWRERFRFARRIL